MNQRADSAPALLHHSSQLHAKLRTSLNLEGNQLRYFLFLCVLTLQFGCTPNPLPDDAASTKVISTTFVSGQNGVVSSRSALASEVGIDIMMAGGNAIDAAVATGFALAVTYPSAGNIGGGGFALIRLADGTIRTLDSRERAPAAAHRDMFLDEEGNVISGLATASHAAAGVPGTVDGLLMMLEAHGTMSRQQVLEPAIRLAEEAFHCLKIWLDNSVECWTPCATIPPPSPSSRRTASPT